MTPRRSIAFQDYESRSDGLAQNGSDPRTRLRRGDAIYVDAVAEGRLTQHLGSKLHDMGHIFTGILFALFVAVLLLAILMGTNVYRALYNDATDTDRTRLGTSLIANTIRANDSVEGLRRDVGPEGDALVLLERSDITGEEYHTRIYKSQGRIVEEYALAGNPYNPDHAIAIIDSEIFEFEYSHGLLTLRTDEGAVAMALRSGEGGA